MSNKLAPLSITVKIYIKTNLVFAVSKVEIQHVCPDRF